MTQRTVPAIALLLIAAANAPAQPPYAIPDDFPRFVVPGQERAMESLRDLYWRHYVPGGPLATLWDEWLSGSTLWPATAHENRMESIRTRWSQALSARIIDPEGYVATHQHASIAHQLGWPFPFWMQSGGPGAWGWHFSLANVPPGWHATTERNQEGWELIGGKDLGIADTAWNLELTSAGAAVRTPPLIITPDMAPFVQLRWRAEGLGNAQPYIAWTSQEEPDWSPERRYYFEPIAPGGVVYTMIPVYRSPAWKGHITRLAVHFDNPPGAKVGIQALFTNYDTRHNINNQNFVRGCCQYFWWTRDLNFLRNNLARIRLAMLYQMHDLGGLKEKLILAPFPGHDGRAGYSIKPDGTKVIHSGRSIGNNYWDLLPMGYKDAYATIHYYDTLHYMARLEEEIAAHPEWNLPGGPLRREPDMLRRHAAEVKDAAGSLFWNGKTGRFNSGIDADGKAYDYGFTFINCEAVHYGFATTTQAESILRWLAGERTVEGDTSTGKDLYHWRFAPRATTRRNVEWYFWAWSAPESIPFGGQVQDGGAVLGFSYHDLMSRLGLRGPDDAWTRLSEIIRWYDEVQAAGGYRAYYKDPSKGTLQGGGTAGGLGIDSEFFESILVPQVMINGFLGFRPRGDGFELDPRLPGAWPSLHVSRIRFHRLVLDVTATRNDITVAAEGECPWPVKLYLPEGSWLLEVPGQDSPKKLFEVKADQGLSPGEIAGRVIRFVRQGRPQAD